MVQAPGIVAPASEAEATRRELHESGRLRLDLHPLPMNGQVVFAVHEGPDVFDFKPRTLRPKSYTDLLAPELVELAPRAFDNFGDIAIVKIPDDAWDHRAAIGEALLAFLDARAVFHDRGVKGTYRVRDLERIAGTGGSETSVQENGCTLHADVGKAYFSPRLASERARVAGLIEPGEHVVDLFGGVAPFSVQAAKAGARATNVDLNPDALPFAERNVAANKVQVDLHCGDSRDVALRLDPANRIIMNLPHGAKDFLDVAKGLILPGGTVHYHEIMADAERDARGQEVAAELGGTVNEIRQVRQYSPSDSHWVFDVVVA